MVLKQRKRINNLKHFYAGLDNNLMYQPQQYNNILGTQYYGNNSMPITSQHELLYPYLDPNVQPVNINPIEINQGTLNTNRLKFNTNGIGDAINGTVGMIGSIAGLLNSVKGEHLLLNETGISNNTIMGVGYNTLNNINNSLVMNELNSNGLGNTLKSTGSGASAGFALGGPIGGVIGAGVGLLGGLFGWGKSKRKQRRRLLEALDLINRNNTFNRSSAMSTGLTNLYYSKYGNTYDDILYRRGKD